MQNIFNIIYRKELSLLNPEIRKSADELSTLLADDFVEFGSSGLVYYKPDAIDRIVSNNDIVEYNVSNYGLKILSDNIIQATYKTEKKVNNETTKAIRCSMWRKSDIGEWQMFFHQGTLIHD